MRALNLGRVHILGESTGGRVGGLFAAKYPEKVASLALCSVPLKTRNYVAAASLESTGMTVRQWAQTLIDHHVLTASDPAKRAWLLDQMKGLRADVIDWIRAAGAGIDLEPSATRLSMPTLILAPADSDLVPLMDSVSLYELLPKGHIAIIEGPTHEIYLDAQEACQRIYLDFLNCAPSFGASAWKP